ncbi:MAG: endonuclease/exonuclease/phosphatase family protein [Rhodocyclaceae bacterium]|nr:endonuclease/exonuclease/phosphatase family protein [Rhodocyclaceae bacterium]
MNRPENASRETGDPTSGFTVASYNVLANAYLVRRRYRNSPPELLEPSRRIAALVEHLCALGADLMCLQEVEPASFRAIDARLSALGYVGRLVPKGQARPDGCASFVNTTTLDLIADGRHEYEDGGEGRASSGHIAQFLLLGHHGRRLGIANTHLKWDSPALPAQHRYGPRQMRELLAQRERQAPHCDAWLVCGDFNAPPASAVTQLLAAASLHDAHAGVSPAATCNPNGRTETIDFIFHGSTLAAEPRALPPIADDTPLPGPGQPSDHVAVVARFAWCDESDVDRRP